jgi:hypothetical protein
MLYDMSSIRRATNLFYFVKSCTYSDELLDRSRLSRAFYFAILSSMKSNFIAMDFEIAKGF